MKSEKYMKQRLLIGALAVLLLAACGEKSKAPRLENQTDTLSWVMGENLGLALDQMENIQLDYDLVMQAMKHTLDGKEQPISDSAFHDAMNYIIFMQQQEALRKAEGNKSMVDRQQEAYFANLEKENPNVKKHPAGFYYEVLKQGKGRTAEVGLRVSFDYRSFLMFSGEAYDQTYGKRDPILHVVGKPMFPGLIAGMQLMNEGSIYRFYFPYQLAFGERGSDPIPGFTPFIYEVELHKIYND